MRENRFSTSPIARLAALAAALCFAAIPLQSPAQVTVGFTIGQAPPPLPYYTQPALSSPGQVWEPGYWAWGSAGYYWVPGTWVTPPSSGLYWTPGYWGYNNGGYAWNTGYWAPQVGYYGGINYGFGYPGSGYYGGMWQNGRFMYNTAYTAVNPNVVRTVYVNRAGYPMRVVTTRYSYNGPGGVIYRPNAREIVVMHERHIVATNVQIEHARIAAQDRNSYYVVNRGRPATVAVVHPIETVRALPHYQPVTAEDRHTVTTRTTTTTHVENAKATTTTTTRTQMHAPARQNVPTHAQATKPPDRDDSKKPPM